VKKIDQSDGEEMKIKLTKDELDEIIHAFELVDGEYNFTDNQRDLYNKLIGMQK
jgi:predicted DNA-binding antitoxin AbrB/MazE fold protein